MDLQKGFESLLQHLMAGDLLKRAAGPQAPPQVPPQQSGDPYAYLRDAIARNPNNGVKTPPFLEAPGVPTNIPNLEEINPLLGMLRRILHRN